jgi:hypothetical protein
MIDRGNGRGVRREPARDGSAGLAGEQVAPGIGSRRGIDWGRHRRPAEAAHER